MTVGDYVALADMEVYFNAPDEKENRWRSLLKTSFDIPLWAVRSAQPTKGRFPVLIYAPSDSSVSWENADLCEYVASHGYVVVASPSMGVSTRDMQTISTELMSRLATSRFSLHMPIQSRTRICRRSLL